MIKNSSKENETDDCAMGDEGVRGGQARPGGQPQGRTDAASD
jgi:hypothetical protein